MRSTYFLRILFDGKTLNGKLKSILRGNVLCNCRLVVVAACNEGRELFHLVEKTSSVPKLHKIQGKDRSLVIMRGN